MCDLNKPLILRMSNNINVYLCKQIKLLVEMSNLYIKATPIQWAVVPNYCKHFFLSKIMCHCQPVCGSGLFLSLLRILLFNLFCAELYTMNDPKQL